jgi:transcriptional regulator with XRE-family HTH domain
MEPNELLGEIGDTVRRLRAARGFSKELFAQATGLNRAHYGGIERGQRNVDAVNLHWIARAPGMIVSEFLAQVERAIRHRTMGS